MEFVEGIREKEVLELPELLEKTESDGEIFVEGAVHSIRNMGEIAFVILRKRDGLLQTVWEEGKTELSVVDLKEGDCIRAAGMIRNEERAPHGKELRLTSVEILSSPAAPLPLAVDKWKLNTSLETKLNLRPISLRNVSVPVLRYRRACAEVSVNFYTAGDLPRCTHRKSARKGRRAVPTFLNSAIFINRQFWSKARSFINR